MDFTPQNMQAVGQLPLMHTARGMDFLRQAKQNDAATLEEAMRENQRKQQEFMLKQRQGEATLADTQAITQGRNIANEWAPKQNQVEFDAKLFKLTQDKSIEELEAIKRDAYKLMISDNPEAQKRGRQVYERMPEIMEKRKAAEAAKEEWQAQDKTTRYVADVGARSREQVAATAAAARQAATAAAFQKLSPGQFRAAMQQKMMEAQQAGDMESAKFYHAAIQYSSQTEAVANPGAGAATPNPAAFQGEGNVPLTVPRVTPPQMPGAPAQQPIQHNPVTQPQAVKTQAEYDALPSGAVYQHPDGSIKRKK